ncbi:TIGR03905 family TSCPD domain-containing protein [Pseudodesulfovibrio sediminis]|uniref:ribonucleoside-diphosphate reductase n=1 Tax=Pseudodesulfovibrio sediminis TaxID=2810563 RepID=A0ABN6ET73_9BACT|nr:TIGR03905 family TSCPD domain-containing protein [Pseudodesulfovibrio sediminis]BCS88093.1 TSCPD domain-containing protein [Pseudodesulfovibrio sediminis]
MKVSLMNVGAPSDAVTFVPEKVCAKSIRYAVEDGKLAYIDFVGGCEGNLKALSTLLKGMEIADVISKLSGITCGMKSTSCADQLCVALKAEVQ